VNRIHPYTRGSGRSAALSTHSASRAERIRSTPSWIVVSADVHFPGSAWSGPVWPVRCALDIGTRRGLRGPSRPSIPVGRRSWWLLLVIGGVLMLMARIHRGIRWAYLRRVKGKNRIHSWARFTTPPALLPVTADLRFPAAGAGRAATVIEGLPSVSPAGEAGSTAAGTPEATVFRTSNRRDVEGGRGRFWCRSRRANLAGCKAVRFRLVPGGATALENRMRTTAYIRTTAAAARF